MKKHIKLNWFKIAQEQQSFGFYNDPKYQGENPREDSYFKEWAETYSSEYASEGLYENTVAFYGKIPPKYLKIHQE